MDGNVEQYCHLKTCACIYYKVMLIVGCLSLFAYGCGLSRVHIPPPVMMASESSLPIQSADFEASIQRLEAKIEAREPIEGGEVIFIEQAESNEVSENTVTPQGNQLRRTAYCHPEELVGVLELVVPEPDLIEDPLFEDSCIESAYSWCDPAFEAEYLAYLEQAKQPEFETSIFPNFISPIDTGMLIRGIQSPGKKWRGHYGLDIIPEIVSKGGTPIKAAEDGVVVLSGRASGYGYYIVIYHQNGLFSLYSHTMKNKFVEVGQAVKRGDKIALMGKSGNAKGYHLHFELIDLREIWDLPEQIDDFVECFTCGGCIDKNELKQFCKLLFSKQAKKDPLPSIAALAMAKKVNGKWVAAPMPQTSVKSKE